MTTKIPGIVVDPLVTESLKPEISDPDVRKLLPTRGEYPIRCSVNIRGINNAIANAIRRVLIGEMANYALDLCKETWQTTDGYLNVDFIAHRVQLVPLTRAKVAVGDKYVLSVENNTDELMSVRTNMLRAEGKKAEISDAFFDTIELFTLRARCRIYFEVIVVAQDGAPGATAFTALAIPFDERPANIVDPEAGESITITKTLVAIPDPTTAKYVQSSSLSYARNWQIVFESVGKGTGEEILARVIDTIIERTLALLRVPIIRGQDKQVGSSAMMSEIDVVDDLYTIKVPGETHTIGNLFVRCAFEVFTGSRALKLVTYQSTDINDEICIRFRINQDSADDVRKMVVDYIVTTLRAIKKQLN